MVSVLDSFNAIPVFVAVAEQGGFSAAARVLGISKSAISKRITLLESQLGARLFHRNTRQLSLTEAGERFYEHAVLATRAAQQAEDAMTELQGEPRGLLKINVPMSFGRLHIAPLIPQFLARYPHTRIDLVMDDRHLDLVGQGFDLAIRAGELPDSTLIARPLASLKSVICCAPSFVTHTALNTPADLAQENCILYSYSSNADCWQFTRSNETLQVNVSGNYRVNSSEALKAALIAGAGIGRLPTFVAYESLQKGELITLFSDYQLPEKMIHAVYPERSYVPAKVRAFLDFALEHFGLDDPYWDQLDPR